MIVSQEKFISQAYHEVFGTIENFGALSGPSFAEEMMKKHPTLVVIASKNKNIQESV